MSTNTMEPESVDAEKTWEEEFPQLSLEEIIDDLDVEGLTNEDLQQLPELLNNYVGVRVELKQGTQSISWTDEQKKKAIEAVGGGDADSASMSSRIWPKGVESIKDMGSARSELGALKQDPFYTRHHPRSGLRRVRIGKMEEYEQKLEAAKQKIHVCAVAMNAAREEIKIAAEKHLKKRYKDAAHIFDQDFTEMFLVDWTPEELGVPPAIKQFQEIWIREGKKTAACGAASLLIEKREIFEGVLGMLDDVAERLEGRRLLDKKHEVMSVEKAGRSLKVTYLDADVVEGRKPAKEIILTKTELAERVAEDERPRQFQDTTPQKLLSDTDYWEEIAKAKGMHNGDMKDIFNRIRKMTRGQSKETIATQLRQSGGMREGYTDGIGRIGNAILDHASLQGRRDILRKGKCKSRALNSDRK